MSIRHASFLKEAGDVTHERSMFSKGSGGRRMTAHCSPRAQVVGNERRRDRSLFSKVAEGSVGRWARH